jgi:hypothetical protein
VPAPSVASLALLLFWVGYDLLRRTTCIGDPWRLGGPGFTTPITPASGNVMIPAHQRGLCAPKRAVVKARG